MLGEPGYDDQLTDYSADGAAARAELARDVLAELDGINPDDDADRLCGALLREVLGSELVMYEAGEHLMALRILGSPVSAIREVFDLAPKDSDADWANIGARMAKVPDAYQGFESALRAGMADGLFAAPRQAQACAEQTATWAGLDGAAEPWFAGLAAKGPDSRRAELDRYVARATDALAAFTRFLRDEYAPRAQGVPDAVGTDRYVVHARQYLGANVDIDDAYAYGWAELERIEDDMRAVAARIVPGASINEVYAHLEREGEAIEGED